MRKGIIFISALFFLISSTELHELSKIPFLLVHFTKHHAEDPTLTFNEFLKLHYSLNHPDDNDDNQDKNLPFKSGFQTHIDIATPVKIIVADKSNLYPVVKITSYFNSDKLSDPAFSIFHPPQFS